MQHRFYKLTFSLLAVLVFCLLAQNASATHNRAGEITYVQTDVLTIVATITTYTKASSVPADRDSLMICWGDMRCQWVQRSVEQFLPNDTKFNQYVATHTYSGQAHYTISMTDPNRNGGILNVNPPSSDNVPFHLETTVTFFNPQFSGFNNSPVLLQPPIDIACVDRVFVHNPNAFDADGDSLAYRLITPLQDVNTQVPNYSFPDQISSGPGNAISFNQTTGTFTWNSPKKTGEYNIAMYIIEYRDGVAIDTMIRDMQILVEDCENDPPQIETISELCVIAGELIEFDVTATAPLSDTDQKVEMTATGGPFELDISPAQFNVVGGYQPQPLVGIFRWQTTCEHISDQFYNIIFRAADNFPILDGSNDTLYLSTLKVVRIKVVGPPPQDVLAEADNGEVTVSWENPYSCEDAEDDYFIGFTVWRREGSNPFPSDTCETGLAGKGYTQLNTLWTREIVGGRYYYLDQEVERGRTYCYRILAEFARTSAGNHLFNFVESMPSMEYCVQLSRDIPLITHVDVDTNGTDLTNGRIIVQWTKPKVEDLDTLANPGPYRYQVLRAVGMTDVDADFAELPGASFVSATFAGANDTVFVDNTLNTVNNPYSYKIAFYTGNAPDARGSTNPASSIYLSIASTDETNILSWEEMVPWNNSVYTIYRQNDSGVFDSIGISNELQYTDSGLLNGKEYCYYLRSEGSYGIDGIVNPIFNRSQEHCGIPLDTIPPCPPLLKVFNICNDPAYQNDCASGERLENLLAWQNPIRLCEETDDVVGYNVYYTPVMGGEFSLIHSTLNSLDTSHLHIPEIGIAGCYAVTAIDTFNNESAFSNIICVDNCPIYELPNVFTPNGDGVHEVFEPFPYCFVDRVDMKIYNRWGQVIFETTDPDIQWDGRNLSGKELAEGVYYYHCRVFEQRVSGVVIRPEILSGYIELLRGQQ